MKFYDLLIKLNNEPFTDVWKKDVPAAEALLLESMHGQGSILEMNKIDEKEINHQILSEKLKERYGKYFNEIFGNSFVTELPEEFKSKYELAAEMHKRKKEEQPVAEYKRPGRPPKK